jgi:hypothetical protein
MLRQSDPLLGNILQRKAGGRSRRPPCFADPAAECVEPGSYCEFGLDSLGWPADPAMLPTTRLETPCSYRPHN